MAKRNKNNGHKEFWGPVINILKDGFLGGLLLIAISHGVHVFSKSLENEQVARQNVLQQFMVSKNLLVENIANCKREGKISKEASQKILDERKNLVKLIVTNKQLLEANEYLYTIQYTRFLDSTRVLNLCAMSNKDLDSLMNQANALEIKLRIKTQ